MKIIVSENQFDRVLSNSVTSKKSDMSYSKLSYDQKERIKKLGVKVFNQIKNFKSGDKPLNFWLNKYGLNLQVPSKKFLIQNIDDIKFARENLPLKRKTFSNLADNLLLLMDQLDNPNDKIIILFHEDDNWSLVNMFDNNIRLWVKLMNERYKNIPVDSYDEVITEYFSGDVLEKSPAAHDLLQAMLKNRKSIFQDIFSKTWGGGTKVEESFFYEITKKGFSKDNIKIFSGEGNFVDRAGIDAALYCNGGWIPVQIKSSQEDAMKNIPYKGISIYPANYTFYYFCERNEPPKPIDDFIKSCDSNESPC